MDAEQHFIYDLVSELRKNPRRREVVLNALKRVDSVTASVLAGKASRSEIVKAEAALVPACGFNYGLLIPKMFPRYPFDEPLDFSSRPFMFVMTSLTPGSVVTLKAGRQVGKCADGDTLVTTQGGAVSLRDIFNAGTPVSA